MKFQKLAQFYVISYMLKIFHGIHLIIFVAQFVPTICFHINKFDFLSDKLKIIGNMLNMRYKFIEYIRNYFIYNITFYVLFE